MDSKKAKALLGLGDDYTQELLNTAFATEKARLTALQSSAATPGAQREVTAALTHLEAAYDVLWQDLIADRSPRATPISAPPAEPPARRPRPSRAFWSIAIALGLLLPLGAWLSIHSGSSLDERDLAYGDRILERAQGDLLEIEAQLVLVDSWSDFVLLDDKWAESSPLTRAFIAFLDPYKQPKLDRAMAQLDDFAARFIAAREAWDRSKSTRSLELIPPLQTGIGNIRRGLELDAQEAKDEDIPLEALQAFVADHHPIEPHMWTKLSWYCPPSPDGPAYIGDTTRLETAILSEAENLLLLSPPRALPLLETRVESLANRPHPGLAQPQRFARLKRDVQALKTQLQAAAVAQQSALMKGLQQTRQSAREQYSPAMQSFWGNFSIVGAAGRQSLRNRDSGQNVLSDQAAILGVQPPVVLGRRAALGAFKLWNLHGEELASFTGPVSLVTGRDTENHFVFTDPARRDRRYFYVPDKGMLARLAPSGDARADDPIQVLVIDGTGNVLQQAQGYWRF